MKSAIKICKLRDYNNRLARDFIDLPFRIYRDNDRWVPWFRGDVKRILRRAHPFFDRSFGDFFVATKGHETVGRLAVFENTRYNFEHNIKSAHFYFFDAPEDRRVTGALFDAAIDWAKGRDLDVLLGPMGFGGATGGGVLIDGFDHRAAMTMMAYNHPYYAGLLEGVGFAKYLDLYSSFIDASEFRLPERVVRVAQRVLARGNFKVLRFKSKTALKRVAPDIARVYNRSEHRHSETYSYSEGELKQVIRDLLLVADPSLIKVLTYRDQIVGYLFAFPDLSAALQRSGGRLNPLVMLDLKREFKRTDGLVINGAGILPRYQRLGGNALLYYELEKTVRESNYQYADLVQVAETTTLMLSDIKTLGGKIYKTHRIYRLNL